MTKGLKYFICILLLGFISLQAEAQFYSWGEDPCSTKWSQISTRHFRIVYPEGLDSLSRIYAAKLEKHYPQIEASSGFFPGQTYRKKQPVVLHTQSVMSNGMSAMAPRRMDLITTPEIYSSCGTPWAEHLTIHESRHAAQTQFANSKAFKTAGILLGEMGTSAMIIAYTDFPFLEGDAVVTETALTTGGRGRQAAFLNYWHCALGEDAGRDWYQWRYGSLDKFTPDYYTLGYVTMAGVRTVCNEPLFVKKYYQRALDHFLPIGNFNKTLKEINGGKGFKQTFTQITDSLKAEWAALDSTRAPFMPYRQIFPKDRRFTVRDGITESYGYFYATRGGIDRPLELIRFQQDGKEKVLGAFNSNYTGFKTGYEDSPAWWTEEMPDPRWNLRSYSNIRYLDKDGKKHSFTRKGKYFRIALNRPAGIVSAIELSDDGNSSIEVFDIESRRSIRKIPAPEGFQFMNESWLNGKLYALALAEEGYSLFRLGDSWERVLGPVGCNITELLSQKGKLTFVADASGVKEFYSFDPDTGETMQMSVTRYGGSDFQFTDQGDSLIFSAYSKDGQYPCITAIEDLPIRKVDLSQRWEPLFARTVTEQERQLGTLRKEYDADISEPQHYSRIGHPVRIHSWAPMFIDYDAVANASFETLVTSAAPGATIMFQNDLANFSGTAGLKLDVNSKWRPSAHLDFKYSGLYPVFEVNASLNDGIAMERIMDEEGKISSKKADSKMAFNATVKAYVPLKFSSGGWQRGIIPQVSWSFSNDSFTSAAISAPLQKAAVSLRGYTMRPVASSGIYPRWGIGAEIGSSWRPGLEKIFLGNTYLHLYGYLPGVLNSHGIKLSALAQTHTGSGAYCEPYAVITPRGFIETKVSSELARYKFQTRISADYALPFGAVDWSFLSPVAYIRNFELIPHADYTWFGSDKSTGALMSVGTDFNIVLGNLLWIPYTTRIGITYSYKGGRSWQTINDNVCPLRRHYFGFSFSVDI